ncbi:hypothetical protein SERLA73DRAFT_155609 [Serpula lacrymans var. lacrymans S7.3]|uniref:Uncharacterized protein n=1 Tax=Serpula lacrymans var. lacrymans (strain S7.3) TaxID=936435 RepID=F8QBN3_SERL3|nr:hypothetical protein SERLA73DRAFT_155609 [Serpula lacrymans var. lacrymans S7.3]
MSTEDLISLRIRQLEKRQNDLQQAALTIRKTRLRSKAQFEKLYARRMFKNEYQPGELVLVRNTQVEKELDRKESLVTMALMKLCDVLKEDHMLLKEMDGSVSRRGIAAFRLLPYFNRHSMPLLDELDDHDNDLDEPEDEPDYEHNDSDDEDNN